MRKFSALVVVCILLVGFGVSCEKKSGAWSSDDQTVPIGDIPLSYGSLEAVTSVPEYPGWCQMWFEDSVGTIRVVRVHMAQNLMHKKIKTIARITGI
jgi:hypothetical protein